MFISNYAAIELNSISVEACTRVVPKSPIRTIYEKYPGKVQFKYAIYLSSHLHTKNICQVIYSFYFVCVCVLI